MYTIFLSTVVESSYETPYTAYAGVIYVIKVIFVSPLIGLTFGIWSVIHMLLVLDKHNEEYSVLRIIIPICATFISFIVSNYLLKVSGVLSCIFSGLVFTFYAPGLIFKLRSS
jgi:lantibiotic modifying enzyme